MQPVISASGGHCASRAAQAVSGASPIPDEGTTDASASSTPRRFAARAPSGFTDRARHPGGEDLARVDARHVDDEAVEVDVGAVVGAVGRRCGSPRRAGRNRRTTGQRGAFHLHRQRRAARDAQRPRSAAVATIAADHQALVQKRAVDAEVGQVRSPMRSAACCCSAAPRRWPAPRPGRGSAGKRGGGQRHRSAGTAARHPCRAAAARAPPPRRPRARRARGRRQVPVKTMRCTSISRSSSVAVAAATLPMPDGEHDHRLPFHRADVEGAAGEGGAWCFCPAPATGTQPWCMALTMAIRPHGASVAWSRWSGQRARHIRLARPGPGPATIGARAEMPASARPRAPAISLRPAALSGERTQRTAPDSLPAQLPPSDLAHRRLGQPVRNSTTWAACSRSGWPRRRRTSASVTAGFFFTITSLTASPAFVGMPTAAYLRMPSICDITSSTSFRVDASR